MVSLTFGEQVKIILNRKGMTIKELAEQIEICTGKKMSRQNLTQRLGRDNFQEQDMRLIAQILGCPFQLSILATNESVERASYIEEIEPTELEIQKLVKKRFEREEKGKVKVAERAPLADETISEEEAAIEREVTIEDLIDTEELAKEQEKEEIPVVEETQKEEMLEFTEGDEDISEFTEVDAEEAVEESEELINETISAVETEAPVQEMPAYKEPETQEYQTLEAPVYQEEEQYNPMPEGQGYQTTETQNYYVPEQNYYTPEQQYYGGDQSYTGEEEYVMPTRADKKEPVGDINPYTRKEYETNSVRMHPKRIGYVQVYDRADHKWTDMTEWAFLGFQERKKRLQGKDYIPPTYLD